MESVFTYTRIPKGKFPIWEVLGETNGMVETHLIGDRYLWVCKPKNTVHVERRHGGRLRFEEVIKIGKKLYLKSGIDALR
jgi:hypothetical protein